MVTALTSSGKLASLKSFQGGFISLLQEGAPELKLYALSHLNNIVDQFWAEISDSISKMYV
jgi:26S proteasome regulatory subunit N2